MAEPISLHACNVHIAIYHIELDEISETPLCRDGMDTNNICNAKAV